jgi:hypothetical protein
MDLFLLTHTKSNSLDSQTIQQIVKAITQVTLKKIRNSLNDKIGAKIPIAEGLGEKCNRIKFISEFDLVAGGSAGSTSGEMLSWSSDSTWDFPPPPGFSPTPSDDNGSHFSLFQSVS